MLGEATRTFLLASAREALAQELGCDAPVVERPNDPALEKPARVFVSWYLGDRLLGCIGTLQPHDSLLVAVRHYAVQSALHDPRVGPMSPSVFPRARVGLSVLGDPRDLDAVGLEAIEAAIEPGRDGVILRRGLRRAVFLPLVWEKLPHRREFLHALAKKAGIDVVRETADVRAQVFGSESFEERT